MACDSHTWCWSEHAFVTFNSHPFIQLFISLLLWARPRYVFSIWLIFLKTGATLWALALHAFPKLSHLLSKYLLRFQTYTWAHFILNFRSDLRGSSYTQNHYRTSIAVVSYTHGERKGAGLLWHLGPRQFCRHQFPLPLRSSPLEFLPVCCFQLLRPLFPANL